LPSPALSARLGCPGLDGARGGITGPLRDLPAVLTGHLGGQRAHVLARLQPRLRRANTRPTRQQLLPIFPSQLTGGYHARGGRFIFSLIHNHAEPRDGRRLSGHSTRRTQPSRVNSSSSKTARAGPPGGAAAALGRASHHTGRGDVVGPGRHGASDRVASRNRWPAPGTAIASLTLVAGRCETPQSWD
jgi:hypothetical protein